MDPLHRGGSNCDLAGDLDAAAVRHQRVVAIQSRDRYGERSVIAALKATLDDRICRARAFWPAAGFLAGVAIMPGAPEAPGKSPAAGQKARALLQALRRCRQASVIEEGPLLLRCNKSPGGRVDPVVAAAEWECKAIHPS